MVVELVVMIRERVGGGDGNWMRIHYTYVVHGLGKQMPKESVQESEFK